MGSQRSYKVGVVNMPYDAVFNANEVAPRQGGGAHPVGNKFPFTITHTFIKSTKDNKGGIFEVEFTSNVGSIKENYNLWNESETARNIAKGELSALCHATGIFQIDFKNDGAALRGAKGLMDIGFQKGHEPSAEKPEGGYVEIKKIYDIAGNEPGKNAAPQQQVTASGFQQVPPPQQQTQQNGFGTAPQVQQNTGFAPSNNTNPAPQQNNPGNGWSGAPQNQQPPQQQVQPNNGGWGSQGTMPQQAPWGGGQ